MVIKIYDWNDLDERIQGANGNNNTQDYALNNDLDSSTDGYVGIGNDWQPCGYNVNGNLNSGFHGTFDGKGYEIRDLEITDSSINSSNQWQFGLFGSTTGGDGTTIIKNLGVRGSIDITDPTNAYAGMIVGRFQDADKIVNCYAEGEINAPNLNTIGGIAGRSKHDMYNCYSLVSVEGNKRVGGLVGSFTDIITQCYSAGSVTGNSDVGGFIGLNDDAIIDESIFDTESSGQSDSNGGEIGNPDEAEGYTTSEMQGDEVTNTVLDLGESGVMSGFETVDGNDLFTNKDGYPEITKPLNREKQLNAQNIFVPTTDQLTGTVTQNGSGVSGAYVFGNTRPSDKSFDSVTTDSNGNYSVNVPKDGEIPFEVVVGVVYDDGSDNFSRAKTILFK